MAARQQWNRCPSFLVCLLLAQTAIVGVFCFFNLASRSSPRQELRKQRDDHAVNGTQVLSAVEEGSSAENTDEMPVATFNGLNVYYRNAALQPLHSTVSCVGENFNPSAWMYRSCEFRNLCFDTNKRDFVLFPSPAEKSLDKALYDHDLQFVATSTSMVNVSVAIGGINPQLLVRGAEKLEWFPTIAQEGLSTGYYELPSDTVIVPFHSLAGFNVGHLVWDDFLPLYTLLSMFQLRPEEGKRPMYMRYVLDEPLWASCDSRTVECNEMLRKFLPLMGVTVDHFSTIHDFSFSFNEAVAHGRRGRSQYVCARYGAAGLGMLTDHGLKRHGLRKDLHVGNHEDLHAAAEAPAILIASQDQTQHL